MKLPNLTEFSSANDVDEVFAGYNHNLRTNAGEFFDMRNLTSAYYPILSPRPKRGIYKEGALTHTNPDNLTVSIDSGKFFAKIATVKYPILDNYWAITYRNGDWQYWEGGVLWELVNPSEYGITITGQPQYSDVIHVMWHNMINGLIAKDALCYVYGTKFVINGLETGLTLTDGKKTLVSMGAYVIILPDKKYINTLDLTEFGSIEAEHNTSSSIPAPTTFSLCAVDGTIYNIDPGNISPTQPENPADKAYWIDTSSTPNVLRQYSAQSGLWVDIPTTYIRIESTNIGQNFAQYDGVSLHIDEIDTETEHLRYRQHETTPPVYFDDPQLDALDGNFVVWDRGNDYIVVTGMLSNVRSIDNAVIVKRSMPEMDFVIESGNRLWGCRYGQSANGDVVNEIYASKLGDFKNWNCFMGISTDSYVAGCGTDGKWTAAYTYLGYPTFFKENFIHKVYGQFPANFQIQDTACRGVQEGSSKSLAMVNEVLYYKGKYGVCAYDGSLPVEISSALGEEQYENAAAGSNGNKYYISMKNVRDGLYYMFCYDTKSGLWMLEDNTHASEFCNARSQLYYIDVVRDGDVEHTSIKTVVHNGTEQEESGDISWMAETGIIGMYLSSHKYVSQMLIRMSLAMRSNVKMYIQYDSLGEWEHVCSMTSTTLRSYDIPIRPHRCDHFRIRIVGDGDAKIFSITKKIAQGSDKS